MLHIIHEKLKICKQKIYIRLKFTVKVGLGKNFQQGAGDKVLAQPSLISTRNILANLNVTCLSFKAYAKREEKKERNIIQK